MFVPNVGSVYYFSFLPEYASKNGTYSVARRMTFQECLDDNVNLLDEWYTPCGVSGDQYKADLNTLIVTDILKLINPETMDGKRDYLYAPSLYLDKIPDHNVKRYYTLAVGYHIGVTSNPDRIAATISVMKEHMTAATGVTADPGLFEISTTWLSDAQYAEIEASRDQTKKKLFNYFTENVRLREENSKLRTKLRYYEDTYKKLSSASSKPTDPSDPSNPPENEG